MPQGESPEVAEAVFEVALPRQAGDTLPSSPASVPTSTSITSASPPVPQGESPEVSEAVFEAALPRQAGDTLPSSPAGILVAVADRLDSLVGLFAAGCAPSAATDPYGLRRAAYGMLQVRTNRRPAAAI